MGFTRRETVTVDITDVDITDKETPVTTDFGASGLEVMTEAECLTLLAHHSFGRLAVNLGDGPTIMPINFAFVERSIVIRTAPGSKLANAPLTKVAIEVDEVGPGHVWGWSVVARGPAFDISTSIDEYSEHLRTLPFNSWLSGDRGNVLKVAVREISGRRFGNIPTTVFG